MQKAYSTPHFLVLMVRVPGETKVIYLGRGNQYVGIYVSNQVPPSYLRIKDKALDFIRSHIVGCKMFKIEFIKDENGEYYQFDFKTDTSNNYFKIGYHQREMFWILKEKDLVFTSFNNQIQKAGTESAINSEISKFVYQDTIEHYLKTEEAKNTGVVTVKKREKFLLKKLDNIKKDFENSLSYKKLEEAIAKNELDFNVTELNVLGVRFNFVGLRSEWDKKNLVFNRIKKLKRGVTLLEQRLKETEEEYQKTIKGEVEVPVTKEKAIAILWKTKVKHKGQTNRNQSNDYIEFKFFQFTAFLGLNATGNDEIRSLSSKDHYWFHIENYPGSHLILKTDDIAKLTPEMYELIASILRDYSKLSITVIPVMFAQVKNLKGVKGVKGEVTVNKAKYLTCPYREWKAIIAIN